MTGLGWESTCPCMGSGGARDRRGTRLALGGSSRQPRGGSSSAGLGVGEVIGTWGRWLVGARSSAHCRWSQGEAGSWRGIWLSCWRNTAGEREGGSAGTRQGQAGQGPLQCGPWWSEPKPAFNRQSKTVQDAADRAPQGGDWGRGHGPGSECSGGRQWPLEGRNGLQLCTLEQGTEPLLNQMSIFSFFCSPLLAFGDPSEPNNPESLNYTPHAQNLEATCRLRASGLRPRPLPKALSKTGLGPLEARPCHKSQPNCS